MSGFYLDFTKDLTNYFTKDFSKNKIFLQRILVTISLISKDFTNDFNKDSIQDFTKHYAKDLLRILRGILH